MILSIRRQSVHEQHDWKLQIISSWPAKTAMRLFSTPLLHSKTFSLFEIQKFSLIVLRFSQSLPNWENQSVLLTSLENHPRQQVLSDKQNTGPALGLGKLSYWSDFAGRKIPCLKKYFALYLKVPSSVLLQILKNDGEQNPSIFRPRDRSTGQ